MASPRLDPSRKLDHGANAIDLSTKVRFVVPSAVAADVDRGPVGNVDASEHTVARDGLVLAVGTCAVGASVGN
jgi:hypothetical protein